jgi:PKD repeat protein
VSCVKLLCNVDGTASSDTDGTVQSWSWDFGDGQTTTGSTASHSYSTGGSYTITLTVTDNSSMTGSTTRPVTVVTPPAQISFLGSDQFNGAGGSPSVHVPAAVAGGDGLILMMVQNNATLVPATPSGWTQLSSAVKGSNLTTVWRKVASSSDAGAAVTPTVSGVGTGFRSAVTLLAYRGTSVVDPVSTYQSAVEGSTATASHVTPTATVPADNSWVVSLWTDKTSATTSITPPASETQRSATCGTDGGRVCLLASDGNGSVAGGTAAGGLTATASTAGTADTMWTIVLAFDG